MKTEKMLKKYWYIWAIALLVIFVKFGAFQGALISDIPSHYTSSSFTCPSTYSGQNVEQCEVRACTSSDLQRETVYASATVVPGIGNPDEGYYEQAGSHCSNFILIKPTGYISSHVNRCHRISDGMTVECSTAQYLNYDIIVYYHKAGTVVPPIVCNIQDLSEYRCSGSNREIKYQTGAYADSTQTSCATAWKTVQTCQYGCSNNVCNSAPPTNFCDTSAGTACQYGCDRSTQACLPQPVQDCRTTGCTSPNVCLQQTSGAFTCVPGNPCPAQPTCNGGTISNDAQNCPSICNCPTGYTLMGGTCTQDNPGGNCLDVKTYGYNPANGECREFATSCIPTGWSKVTTCEDTNKDACSQFKGLDEISCRIGISTTTLMMAIILIIILFAGVIIIKKKKRRK